MGLHCLPSYLFMVEQVPAWPVAKRDTGHTILINISYTKANVTDLEIKCFLYTLLFIVFSELTHVSSSCLS